MRQFNLLKLAFLPLLFVACASVIASAQQYQIIRAEYGYGDQRVDVTQRLQELAREHARFRMGNSTFGVDPSRGNVKTLYIIATNGRQNRTFEYREGSWVNGARFAGWNGGNWGSGDGRPDRPGYNQDDRPGYGPGNGGGGYPNGNNRGNQNEWQILHALYGTPERNVDVTQRLRDIASRDVRFRMGNSTFGVDPDRGVVKYLRIFARGPNGRSRIFEYREGSYIDGAIFSGWNGGGWGSDDWNRGWGGREHDGDDEWEVERR